MTLPQRPVTKPPLTQRSFPHPALPTGQQPIDPPSSEKEGTLHVLPSALVPRITESTNSPFLVDLGREPQTKAAPTATHTEQPSLLGFESESPSGQGRAQGPRPQRGTMATQDWVFTISIWIPICHIQADH